VDFPSDEQDSRVEFFPVQSKIADKANQAVACCLQSIGAKAPGKASQVFASSIQVIGAKKEIGAKTLAVSLYASGPGPRHY
jgi:hypothetical protein